MVQFQRKAIFATIAAVAAAIATSTASMLFMGGRILAYPLIGEQQHYSVMAPTTQLTAATPVVDVQACGALVAAIALLAASKSRLRPAARQLVRIVRPCDLKHGEDLSVPGDSFIVLGMAHCFEQVDGKLQDVWTLEPVSASTVEVIRNGAATSYETFVGTTVKDVLSKDLDAFPSDLFCGHEVRFCDNLEFRTGCAARTWMRDHAKDVVRKLAPEGQVQTDFNTNLEHKRILNFVHEVKDSDNIKQDMSIDVYGRSEEAADESDAQIEALYNV